MTSRFIYRILIRFHPLRFREQHGDEMLCIFEQSSPGDAGGLYADGLVSLVRQWLFHSGWWKLAAGAAVSGLLVFACGYSISQTFNWSLARGAKTYADVYGYYAQPPDASFNELEFEREAQEAVRMLAGYRREDASRRSAGHRAYSNPSNAPLPPSRNRE